MTPKRGPVEVLIVGDTPDFGRVIAVILGSGGWEAARIRHTTYDGFRGMINPRVLASTDLFVLVLWRTYPTGLRAEGLAVAEELIRQRSRALVVSPLALGGEADLPWYWDLGSVDALDARCSGVMRGFYPRTEAIGELARIKGLLRPYSGKPVGHEKPVDSAQRYGCLDV